VPERSVEFQMPELKPSALGEPEKVEVRIDPTDSDKCPSWHLRKVVLTNQVWRGCAGMPPSRARCFEEESCWTQ
jgi:hypothetical protein